MLGVASGRVQTRQERLKRLDERIRRPAAGGGTAPTIFGAEQQQWQTTAFQKFVDTKHGKQLPRQQANTEGNSSGWKHRTSARRLPGKRAWPREGCGLLAVCRPLRTRVRSGPLLGPPLLGVRLAAQLQMIASGGGSAEVRTFEAWPPAVVGGAEVSLKLGSEVSPMQGTAGGGLGERPGASPASPSRRQGSTRSLFLCKFSRESPLSAPLSEDTSPEA